MSKFDEIIHLTNQLNVYRDAYYNHSVSYVSDKMYDDMFDRLVQLECFPWTRLRAVMIL